MSRAAQSIKADRKLASAAASARHGGTYEDTAFGRRRIRKWPRGLAKLVWLIGVPVLFVYHRMRRSGR